MIQHNHDRDGHGTPSGGTSFADGVSVYWQNGPVIKDEPRGAFVSDVIEIALSRLEHYQDSKLANPHNAEAVEHLKAALAALDARQTDRAKRGVANTHKP